MARTLVHVVAAMAALNIPSRRVGRVEFNTHPYEVSHGRRPGGFGSWAFEVPRGGIDVPLLRSLVDKLSNQPGLVGLATLEEVDGKVRLWMPAGTYGEARAAAARILAAFGAGVVEVCT